MRPRPLSYYKPTTLQDAVNLLEARSMVLNGGQAVIPTLRMRVINPEALIDIKHVAGLSADVEVSKEEIVIGPRVTVESFLNTSNIRDHAAVLHEAGRCLADAQIRSHGTVVGSMCWADPRANYPVALLACDAVVHAHGKNGTRKIAADDFFAGYRANTLREEIVTSVTVPGTSRLGFSTYREFSKQTNDVCIVNVAVAVIDGTLRVAAGGLDKRPQLLPEVAALFGKGAGRPEAQDVLDILDNSDLTPIDDGQGSLDFRFRLVAEMLTEIAADANGALK